MPQRAESGASPSSTPSELGASDDTALWQDTLAAEHAVIWSYGLVGATGDLAASADSALASHRQRRAICLEVIADLGAEAVTSAPSYDEPRPRNTDAARQLAGRLESVASAAYLALSSSADRSTRLLASRWLRESAVTSALWTGRAPALPGFDADELDP